MSEDTGSLRVNNNDDGKTGEVTDELEQFEHQVAGHGTAEKGYDNNSNTLMCLEPV